MAGRLGSVGYPGIFSAERASPLLGLPRREGREVGWKGKAILKILWSVSLADVREPMKKATRVIFPGCDFEESANYTIPTTEASYYG